jgi:YHS domain-containing protein
MIRWFAETWRDVREVLRELRRELHWQPRSTSTHLSTATERITRTMKRNGPISAGIALLGLALGCETEDTSQSVSAHRASMDMAVTPASAPQDDESPPRAPASSFTLVTDRSLVCMVNNQFMGQPQIPIELDGRAYYGCCEMCKGRLESDPSSRVSSDPVSGKTVDKATAVIGRAGDGRVLYFENDQTFATYAQGTSR